MPPDLIQARYLSTACRGFMPTRDQWEAAQRLLKEMADEIERLRQSVADLTERNCDDYAELREELSEFALTKGEDGRQHIAIVFDGYLSDGADFKHQLEQLFDWPLSSRAFERTGSSVSDRRIVIHYHLSRAEYQPDKADEGTK